MTGTETAIPAAAARTGGRKAPGTTLSAPELAAETGATITQAERLLEVAREMVERYAPGAPAAMKNEAVIRFAGYLAGSDYGGVAKENEGPKGVEYTVNHASAWRNCGAAMLLTRWKRRRAGAIG